MSIFLRVLVTAAFAALALFVVSGPASAQTTVGGPITADTTWAAADGPFIVTSTISVTGTDGDDGVTTLTIQPGTTVLFEPSTSLVIGDGTQPGGLDANATETTPILFAADASAGPTAPGSWDGVSAFGGDAVDATLNMSHVTIDGAGAGQAGLTLWMTSASVGNITVQHSAHDGVYVHGGRPLLSGLVARENIGRGIYADLGEPRLVDVYLAQNGAKPLSVAGGASLVGVRLFANGDPAPEILAGVATHDIEWAPPLELSNGTTAPYEVTGRVRVQGFDGADNVTTLHVWSGVTLRFAQFVGMDIGGQDAPGLLEATGSFAKHITITSIPGPGSDTPGFWGGLRFNGVATTLPMTSHVFYTDFSWGGSGTGYMLSVYDAKVVVSAASFTGGGPTGCVDLNVGSTLLSDVQLDGCAGYAVFVHDGTPVLEKLRIRHTAGIPLHMTPRTILHPFITTADSTSPWVELVGGVLDFDNQLIEIFGDNGTVPYHLVGSDYVIEAPEGSRCDVKIERGVHIVVSPGLGFVVGHGSRRASLSVAGATITGVDLNPSGTWNGFRVDSGTSAANASFLSMESTFVAGATSTIHATGASVITVASSSIQRSGSSGIDMGGGSLSLNGVAIASADTAIRMRQITSFTANATSITAVNRGLDVDSTTGNQRFWLTNSAVGADQQAASFGDVTNASIMHNVFESRQDPVTFGAASAGNVILDNAFGAAPGAPPVTDDGQNTWWSAARDGPNVLRGARQGGNAYSDYAGADTSTPPDGIGDTQTPYVIAGVSGATDALPLAGYRGPDLSPPVTRIVLNGSGPGGFWWSSSVTMSFAASDTQSSVVATYASLDGGPTLRVSGALRADAAGLHTVTYHSEDSAGNAETPITTQFGIDLTAPSVDYTRLAPARDLCFEATLSDADSGPSDLTFTVARATDGAIANDRNGHRLDAVPISSGTNTCAQLDAQGLFNITIHGTDAAGNVATLARAERVDTRPPALAITHPDTGHVYVDDSDAGVAAPADRIIVLGSVTVRASASDAGDPVSLALLVDGVEKSAATDGVLAVTLRSADLSPGEHVVTLVARDAAGNETRLTRTLDYAPSPLST